MSKTDDVRLHHMLDAANQAIVFTQGRSRTDLETDLMLALAVVRLIEILKQPKMFLKQPKTVCRKFLGDKLPEHGIDLAMPTLMSTLTLEFRLKGI